MKLREKLFLAAFSIGILILFAGIIASNFGEKLEGEFKESERIRLQVIGSATEISSYVKRAEGHLLLYLLMGDISDGDKFPNRMVLLGDHLEALKPVINEPAERKLIGDMEGKVVKIFSIGNALIELKKNGEFAQRENEAQIKTFHSLTSEVRRNSIKLAQEYIQLQLQKESVLISEMAYAKRKSVILLILSASTALVFGFWWYKNITDNILILKNATGLYAKGEKPNIEINSKDEFGELADAFKKMIFELNLKETLLKEEKVKAEEANAAKSEFLSRMSHELRTPMNAIL
ncbi:MAG: hypothetical protein HOF21_14100 [Nitrospina sp.]|jgi:methyl-accepting chemotaxis protein|nr:hypothetical protein [Nitrospina sp.]MBT5550791.1 hypothetical protein [Nitrospina sp.]